MTKEIRIKLGKKALQQLTWQMEEYDAKNLTDVIKNALSLQQYLLEENNKGWKVILQKETLFSTKQREVTFNTKNARK